MRSDEIFPDVKLFLRIGDKMPGVPGLGLGVVELCERVEKMGSLNRASADMGMAYSKAWRIIKNTEEGLGITLFVRQGARGSHLTDEARALIDIYRQVQKEAYMRAAEKLDVLLDEAKEQGLFSDTSVPDIETKATPELIAQVRALDFQ